MKRDYLIRAQSRKRYNSLPPGFANPFAIIEEPSYLPNGSKVSRIPAQLIERGFDLVQELGHRFEEQRNSTAPYFILVKMVSWSTLKCEFL
jgi:hypothetical protein